MNLVVQFIHCTLPLKSNEPVWFVPATTNAFHCLAARLPGKPCQFVNQLHLDRPLRI